MNFLTTEEIRQLTDVGMAIDTEASSDQCVVIRTGTQRRAALFRDGSARSIPR